MAKPVRMADIAEKLDISVVSVSKALSGKPGVSEEMRAKIVALAKQLGYEGTKVHSELAGTGNIGVLVSDRFFAENAFYTNLYRSLVLKSGSTGFTCVVEIITPEAERSCALPSLITGRKVDGIIFMGNLAPAYLRTVEEAGLPGLLLDFQLPGRARDCVISDNLDGGYALTEHLLSQGRRQIGFVGSIRATTSIMDRYLGYQKALRLAGLIPREEWLLEDRDQNGLFIPLQLPDPLPEAFLCSCDEVAYNLVEALRRMGKRVPEDVAVCGYDDFRFATLCQPPLTTYRVNVEQMAAAVVSWLARRIRQEEPLTPMMWTVPGQLVVRESTGGAAE
ncbi:MAG: LacI family DNA-binding transcriptional regulator [Oscillospiraceae bacterium]|nr:LacI family DNA-binding transcriptional regulator [Oscillospiraceae bacterium]